MLSNKNISLAVGVALAVAFLALTPKSWKGIDGIKERQISSNVKLMEWKNAYQALLPVNKRWVATYPDGQQVKDIVSLYRLIGLSRHGLFADIDKIMQSASSPVLVNGSHVGLQRLCVSSQGSTSMVVTANSIRELREGLRSLSMRSDIDIGGLNFSFNSNTSEPVAEISDLCLKVRVDGEGMEV